MEVAKVTSHPCHPSPVQLEVLPCVFPCVTVFHVASALSLGIAAFVLVRTHIVHVHTDEKGNIVVDVQTRISAFNGHTSDG